MGTGAVSRYKLTTEPENCHVIKSLGMYWCGVRVEQHEGHDIESSMFKNRDKQMPFIVRVSGALFVFSYIGLHNSKTNICLF